MRSVWGLKARTTYMCIEPFPCFVPNTHTLYMLGLWINIVFISQRPVTIIVCNPAEKNTLIHVRWYLNWMINSHSYPLVVPIFGQQKVNWFIAIFPKLTGYNIWKSTRKVTKYSNLVPSQCNLTVQMDSVQDKLYIKD